MEILGLAGGFLILFSLLSYLTGIFLYKVIRDKDKGVSLYVGCVELATMSIILCTFLFVVKIIVEVFD